MNTLHLFLTFALIHAPFALAQTVQEKFEQLVNLSNQEVPKCKKAIEKLSKLSEQKDLKEFFNTVVSDSFYPNATAQAYDLVIANQAINLESIKSQELQCYCGLIPIWDKLKIDLKSTEAKKAASYFLKTNLEKTNNFLAVSLSMNLLELQLRENHSNEALLKSLQSLNQQKEALKSKILEKTKPKPSEESFRFEIVETQKIRIKAYEIYKKLI